MCKTFYLRPSSAVAVGVDSGKEVTADPERDRETETDIERDRKTETDRETDRERHRLLPAQHLHAHSNAEWGEGTGDAPV